jgi:hypothetical protein
VANSFDLPITCDNDGNLYLQSEQFGTSGIRKLNAKGERVALFQPNANPEMKIIGVGDYAISPSGELYEFVLPEEITRYVMVYKSDGSYKSLIKLQPGFAWIPSTLAVFASGNLLVSGLEYDKNEKRFVWPFTAIFSSDGTLLKEVKLEDDDTLRDMAASGDSRVSSSTNPSSNFAIEFGQSQAASDGNVYLMRWVTPTIFYALSPGGGVVRRFLVDPGDENFKPAEMHVAGSRIAVLFYHPQTGELLMKIVDLEGHEIATYDQAKVNGKPTTNDALGSAFACYTDDPQRFTFLTTGDGQKLELRAAEAR